VTLFTVVVTIETKYSLLTEVRLNVIKLGSFQWVNDRNGS
jgi:hypothetical protein